ncbi:MAG TPA: ABC transporter permease [Spirillospora sp.]
MTVTLSRPEHLRLPARGDPATRERGASLRRRLLGLRRWTGVALILTGWQTAGALGLLGRMVPAPLEIAEAAVALTASGELVSNMLASLERVGRGLAIALPAGLVLGLLAGGIRLVEDLIDAPIQAVRLLPNLALAPVFIIWFGVDETYKTALIVSGPVFPLYLAVFHGLRGVDARYLESAKSCGAGRWELIRRVVLPGALPQIFVGLRLALGSAWLTLVVAEQTATYHGLGFMLNDAREFMRIDEIFVVLVVYACLGLATDALIRFLERRTLRWRRAFTDR